jgi:hypothetical protein
MKIISKQRYGYQNEISNETMVQRSSAMVGLQTTKKQ